MTTVEECRVGNQPGNLCRVYGVDFSGAKDAGRKIWLTAARVERGVLCIEECLRADTLPGSARHRDLCLEALRNFITKQKECAIGLDFPFGLPAKLIKQKSWEGFVRSFPLRYSTAEKFRQVCWRNAGNKELRRVTDLENRTPLSPYNRRLYRQTYFGIRDVLRPLLDAGVATVVPMQEHVSGKAVILEVCPASTLKRQGLYFPYKGRSEERSVARQRILKSLERCGILLLPKSAIRRTVLDDSGGDALDSLIAALATFRAIQKTIRDSTEGNHPYRLEGYVYT